MKKGLTGWVGKLLFPLVVLAVALLAGALPAAAQNSRVGVSAVQGNVTIFNNQICSEPTFLAGVAYCVGGPLTVLPAQTAITTVTTIQTMGTFTPWTGFLNAVGKTLRVRGWGVYTQPSQSTGQNLTFTLALGSTALVAPVTTATSTSACTNCQFNFDFWVTVVTTGTAGTVEAHGVVMANLGSATTTALSSFADTNTAVISSVNLTTAQALNLQLTASGGTNALTSATLRGASIEISN